MDILTTERLYDLAERYVVPIGLNVLLAAIILLVGRAVARAAVRGIERIMERAHIDDSLRKFLSDVVYALLLTVVVIATLDRLGIRTTALIAVIGAAGLAVGFALQGSLANFAAGVMIMVFKPYRVGDVVSIGGQIGSVEGIKVFTTVLVSGDNRQISIPNGQVTSGLIENLTIRGTRRIDLVFGIGYGDDIRKAKGILEEILKSDPRVLEDPAPVIAVAELGESSVDLVCRPWVHAADYWTVRFAIVERVKLKFDRAGVSIPFPQRDVHLHGAAA